VLTLYGAGSDSDCAIKPCDIHLSKGGQSKTVSILIRQFHRSDGSEYWHAFETRFIDLAIAKIRDIKLEEEDTSREATLGNLEWEDCEDVVEAHMEPSYDQGDEQDY
jgi:hypothetical protein